MPTKFLSGLASLIELSQSNAPFYVMPRFKDKYDVYETMPPHCVDLCYVDLATQDEAENKCDELNGLYVAKQVINYMRDLTKHVENGTLEQERSINRLIDAVLNEIPSSTLV